MPQIDILRPDEVEVLFTLDLMRKFRRMSRARRERRIAELIAEADALISESDPGHPERSPEERDKVRARLLRTRTWLASVADRLTQEL